MMIGYDPYEVIGVPRWLCARHQDRWHHTNLQELYLTGNPCITVSPDVNDFITGLLGPNWNSGCTG